MFTSIATTIAFVGVSLLIYLIGRRFVTPAASEETRPLAFGPLTKPLAGLVPITQSGREKIRRELVRGGNFHPQAITEFLATRNAVFAICLIGIVALLAVAPAGVGWEPYILIFGLGALGLAYGLPRVLVSSRGEARAKRIHFALPDALDLVTMTISSGLPLRRAIDRVSSELGGTHPDLAKELAIIHHQAETGSMETALQQFADRIDLPDVTALATMVHHAEQIGGNVADSFREFSDSVRRTRRQRAEERGNSTSIKLLFPVVLCLAPPIYVLLLGPAVMELRNFVTRQDGGALDQSISDTLRQATPQPGR